MQRTLFTLTALILLLSGGVATAPHSIANPLDCETSGYGGNCTIEVTNPGSGGGDGGGTTIPIDTGGGETQVCTHRGSEVPCSTDDGYWNGTCYERDITASLDPSDPVWDSWNGSDVRVRYTCPGATTLESWADSVAGPGGGPSPRVLADRAISAMNLRAGQIGITPPPGPGKMGVVGFPTWLWITDPSETTVGPITRTASAGGRTVTATATLDQIVWTMGDGTTVTCSGPGTPYADHFGDQPSPDCGHTYTRTSRTKPGMKYTVSATSHWTVNWSGAGQSGSIPLDFSRNTQIQIGELQVLLTQ